MSLCKAFQEAVDYKFGLCPSDVASFAESVTDENVLMELVRFVYCEAKTLEDLYGRIDKIKGN